VSDAIPPAVPQIPRGYCGVRLHLFAAPSTELEHALRPPWPRWMKRLYETQQTTKPAIDVDEGVVTIAAAVSAVKARLAHRLDVLAWACSALEDLGWIIELQDDTLIASTQQHPADARAQLEDAGVAGPMCAVADLDDTGWPRLWSDTIVGVRGV